MKLGQIVQYVLTKDDVQHINARRALDATSAQARTVVIAHGNPIREGDVFPLIITRLWGDAHNSAVNGQVLLDGNDSLWVTSVTAGDGPRHFTT